MKEKKKTKRKSFDPVELATNKEKRTERKNDIQNERKNEKKKNEKKMFSIVANEKRTQ